MTLDALRLRPFRASDEASAREAHRALEPDDFTFLLDYKEGEEWGGYLDRLDLQSRGVDLPADRVRANLLAAVLDGQLVGRVSVRFELNDWLAAYGGHIGYAVVPDHRRKGYAKEILRQSLVVARAAGIDDVLIVCKEGNIASARTIEACGGVFESLVDSPEGTGQERRYWIR